MTFDLLFGSPNQENSLLGFLQEQDIQPLGRSALVLLALTSNLQERRNVISEVMSLVFC